MTQGKPYYAVQPNTPYNAPYAEKVAFRKRARAAYDLFKEKKVVREFKTREQATAALPKIQAMVPDVQMTVVEITSIYFGI